MYPFTLFPKSDPASILIAKIAKHKAKIDRYLKANRLPSLSFDVGPQMHILEYPPEIGAARLAVVDAAQELAELYMGPKDAVVSLGYVQGIKPAILRFISSYGIHNLVPASGSISLSQIAATTKLGLYVVRHLMHAAISLRLFREDEPEQVSHSAASLYMREAPLASDWVWALSEHCYPGIMAIIDALAVNPQCDDPAQAPWITWKQPSERTWFEFLNRNPAQAKQFANVMTASHSVPGYSLSHMTSNYDWAAFDQVIDMGGSDGRLARALLDTAPSLRVIVQDLPHICAQSQKELDKELADHAKKAAINRPSPLTRLQFIAHNFFEEQPVKHADAYVFRAVLHDWSDNQMTQIMQQLIPALKPGAKVLILDDILPAVGTIGLSAERDQHAMDLCMLAVCAAGSRELREWKSVIRASDPRFVVTNVTLPPGSALGLIEITWQPDAVESEVNSEELSISGPSKEPPSASHSAASDNAFRRLCCGLI